MMNATLCKTTDIALETYPITNSYTSYATAPMQAITSIFQRSNEEELHASFEEALSDRVTAIHSRLLSLSNPEMDSVKRDYNTELMSAFSVKNAVLATKKSLYNPSLWRSLRYSCLALSCTLFGFDLMGLLVLHMH